MTLSPMLRQVLQGGLLPILVFTVACETLGAIPGLIAGMSLGVGEILWEWRRDGKVAKITWIGNGLLLVLGAASLLEGDAGEGAWFKLQPAILEGGAAAVLLGSGLLNKPLLLAVAEKKLPPGTVSEAARPHFEARLKSLGYRCGVFFLVHALLATYAAFCWSTAAWATLKGVGFTASFLAYFAIELLWMRRSARR